MTFVTGDASTGDLDAEAQRLAQSIGGRASQAAPGFGNSKTMHVEIVEYSAFLTLPNLSQDVVEQIQFAARDVLDTFVVTATTLSFDYSGRDTNRHIVRLLCRIAPLIGKVEGEIECRLTNDDGPDFWEYYTISNHRLYRQAAKIVKLNRAEVCQGGEAMEDALRLVTKGNGL